jgi:hypothetical protein
MIGKIKDKLSEIFIKKNLKGREPLIQSFSNFFKKSFTFLVLMPEDETDFNHSVEVIRFLEANRKHIHILTYDYRVSLLPLKIRPQVIEHGIDDLNKFKLPSKKFIDKLSELEINAVVDLNRKPNLFYSYAANLVNAPIRIGFLKDDADSFYNIQIVNKDQSAEISYKNFLNCLEMF